MEIRVERTECGFIIYGDSEIPIGEYENGKLSLSLALSLGEMSNIIRLIEDYAFDYADEILVAAEQDATYATHSFDLLQLAKLSAHHKKEQEESIWPTWDFDNES